MFAVVKKELRQYFSGLLGYMTIAVFLLLTGLVLFVLPESGILDLGYATMDSFFSSAPYIMLILIPGITMKSFSEEYKAGTFEVLRTAPLKVSDLVWGKFFACLLVVLIALLLTLVYVYSLAQLSTEGIDTGGILGSYIGLFFLCAVYAAIGIYTSSLQKNAITAFMSSALICYVVFSVFSSLATIDALSTGAGYYLSLLGIEHHYQNISKGYIDTRDVVYFITVVVLFLKLTSLRIKNHKP
ncbi:MAG: ABC transporter permease [Chitinophagaceae bacterium]|jgi:ABC-2 type transport system permease protein